MHTSSKSNLIDARWLIVWVIFLTSCVQVDDRPVTLNETDKTDSSSARNEPLMSQPSPNQSIPDPFAKAREQMVTRQMAGRDIVNQLVLSTMKKVPRHKFVAEDMQDLAYRDSPLGIGEGQTISQPYIVALMTQLVDPQPHHKSLDIGTGSGYQAAVLAELVKNVYSIEIVESLATQARTRLKTLGYKNIEVRHGDGYRGWETQAPFDIIIVAAAPDHIPQPLIEQLAPGGKLVIPVGDHYQELIVVEKQPDGTVEQRTVAPVTFVPMTGEARK